VIASAIYKLSYFVILRIVTPFLAVKRQVRFGSTTFVIDRMVRGNAFSLFFIFRYTIG